VGKAYGTFLWCETLRTGWENCVYGVWLKCETLYDAYPAEAITRVTNLIHRWSPGTYTLEMALGAVTAEYGLPQYRDRPASSMPGPEPPGPEPPGPEPTPPPPPVVITCPPGYKMVYGDWDYQRQYPYCVKVEGGEERDYYYCQQFMAELEAGRQQYAIQTGMWVPLSVYATMVNRLSDFNYCTNIMNRPR